MPPTRLLTPEEREAEIDRILATPSRGLLLWLKSEGLELTDALPARPNAQGQIRKLKSRGLWDGGHLWIQKESKLLKSHWKVSNYSKVCSGLCRRFVEAKMRGVKPSSIEPEVIDSPELEVLPLDIRWVYLHPGLFPEDDGDPIIQARVATYIERFPAPSNGARNWRDQCRREKGARQKMFDEVKAYLLENRKKKKEAPAVVDEQETARVLDMHAQLAKLKGVG